LLHLPAGILLQPVVELAFRVPVAQTRPATSLVRNVMLEVGTLRRPAAAGPGARGVPDLGQVPQHHPGIMAVRLVPVVAAFTGDRPDLQEPVGLPGDPGSEPPGAVSSRRPGLTGEGEGERCPAGRVRPARSARSSTPFAVAGRCRPRAATRCRAEQGDLCAGRRMAWPDVQPTSGSAE
jgi:hypothetical protein